jgi:hypothetical protein
VILDNEVLAHTVVLALSPVRSEEESSIRFILEAESI